MDLSSENGGELMNSTTLYDRLGGSHGIRAVVDEFYDKLLADEELGPFFEDANMERLRKTQTDFLSEAAGGPETYDGPPVREAHVEVPFEPAHIDRAIELLEETLASFDIQEEDAERVINAIQAYEEELLATPDEMPP